MILALDVDGVLRRHSSPKYQFEAHLVENLERFVRELEERESVEIIITSTWRTAFSLDQIRALFPLSLRVKVIGVTPSFVLRDGSRHEEILAYLKSRGLEAEKCIALDDDPLGFPQGLKNLILCNSEEGLPPLDRLLVHF